MKMPEIIVGSRRSPLARAQASQIIDRLVALVPGLKVGWHWIITSGDRFADRPLQEAGGKGLFLKEIEEALVRGEVDLAIHSGKDVPAELAPGLMVAATPARANPRDILLSRDPIRLDAEFTGVIGTGSKRRAAQIRRRAPRARVLPIRGNVDTRLRKLESGDVDAVVLAAAGLDRLGVDWTGAREELDWMLPAVAQGTLVLETRSEDAVVRDLVERLDDAATRVSFAAERAVTAAVGGDCFSSLAAFARVESGRVYLSAALYSEDGSEVVEVSREAVAADAAIAGLDAGHELRRRGSHLL